MNKDIFKKHANDLFMKDMFIGDKIYLDLRLFFDFTIGSLFHLHNGNEDDYKYIIDQIEEYKNHETIDVKHSFSKLNIDENTLFENMKKYPNEVFSNSPWTLFFEFFKDKVKFIQNHLYTLKSKEEITLNINTYPLKVDKSILEGLRIIFKKSIPNINIKFLYFNLNTVDEIKFRDFNIYFVYYFPEATRNKKILNEFNELKYLDKFFYIHLPIKDEVLKNIIKEIHFACFKFVSIIDKTICMPFDIKGVKEWKEKNQEKK